MKPLIGKPFNSKIWKNSLFHKTELKITDLYSYCGMLILEGVSFYIYCARV